MAWAYKGTITITGSSTLLPSTQTNFPVLVKLDSVNCTVGGVNRIKTTANGGAVQNTGTQSGGNAVTMPFDLVFYSDSGLSTKIPWEIKSYDGTGGTLWARVLMASCALSGNLYFGLGDAAVNTQQNTSGNAPSNVWDTAGTWLFPDGTTLYANDSSANANNGSVAGTVTAAAGQIDGALNNVTAGANGVRVANSASLKIASKISISFWINQASRNANGAIVIQKRSISNAASGYNYGMDIDASGKLFFQFNDGSYQGFTDTGTAVALNTWTHCAVVVDETAGTKITFYRQGAAQGTPAYTGTMPSSGTEPVQISNYDQTFGGVFPINGSMSDLQLFAGARSANWITAEYNTGLAPQTFASVSLAANTSSSGLFRPSTLSGLGAGGPFFQNPLG